MDTFYIIANSQKEDSIRLRDRIAGYLRDCGKICSYQEECVPQEAAGYRFTDPKKVPEDVECVIVLGGDGTVIQAARDLACRDVAFLGVNLGTVGYLAEIEAKEYEEALNSLMRGEYHLESRMMLDGKAYGKAGELYHSRALNDIVISRTGGLRIINFQIFVNGRYLKSYNADGMIISTPTGSTGYNLSAGGPIVEPGADMLLVTPICAHSINARSIVLSGEDVVEVVIGPGRKTKEEQAVATFDGDTAVTLVTGERIVIRKSGRNTKLIKLNDRSFLEILSKKLK
ncbi:MAG: NAD(+)/NADH kinase [Oscillospiraceae bacterium]|nr:NAD(+)/NADH kinase [Oscillospiraceae bacterium]